jgi:AraC-like DNA-binding protein
MLPFQFYSPHSPLDVFVDPFWYYEYYNPPYSREYVVPDGSMYVIIELGSDSIEQSFRHSAMLGISSKLIIVEPCRDATPVIVMRFKPGGIAPFIRIPADELFNSYVSLEDLWGPAGKELHYQLVEAESIRAKFGLIEQFLLLQMSSLPDPVVRFALQEFQYVSPRRTVSSVTDKIGISPRRFIQIFKEKVGTTPKLFCRIQRFQGVLDVIQTSGHIEWSDIAVSCGYFDHSHLIKDFKEFTGVNPSDFVSSLVQVHGIHQSYVQI